MSATTKTTVSSLAESIETTETLDLAMNRTIPQIPSRLIDLVCKCLNNKNQNKEGVYELNNVISELTEKSTEVRYNPDTEVTISISLTQAAYTAITTVVKEDDDVIVIEPLNALYAPVIALHGARTINIKPKSPDFKIDWEEVKKSISSKTKMIIINSPNNVTGKLLDKADMLQLQRLINGTNIYILSDESQANILFDENKHYSVASFEKLRERSFIISSFEYVLNICDWGIAYCLAPEKLTTVYKVMQKIQIGNISNPVESAVAQYLKTNNNFDELVEMYRGKRNYFERLITSSDSQYEVIPIQAGSYMLINYSKVSNLENIEFAELLMNDFGIEVAPISMFYNEKTREKLIRICIAKENSELEKAAEQLLKVPITAIKHS